MAMPKTPDIIGEVSQVMDSLSIGTPKKTTSTSRLRGRTKGKVLFPAAEISETKHHQVTWSDEEANVLVAFLMLHTNGKSWVVHGDTKFWYQAGVFIQQQLKISHCWTG